MAVRLREDDGFLTGDLEEARSRPSLPRIAITLCLCTFIWGCGSSAPQESTDPPPDSAGQEFTSQEEDLWSEDSSAEGDVNEQPKTKDANAKKAKAVIRWEDTPTHRIKIKTINGKEVGRWRFEKKKAKPKKMWERKLKIAEKNDRSQEGCGLLHLKLDPAEKELSEDDAKAAVIELHGDLEESHRPQLRGATFIVSAVGPVKTVGSGKKVVRELQGTWAGSEGYSGSCSDKTKRKFKWERRTRIR